MKNVSARNLATALVVGLMFVSQHAITAADAGGSVASPAGVVGWWAGEGNTSDKLGGNNGTAMGELAYGPGEVGQAFIFNGANTGVRVPGNASLDVGVGAGMTLEAWINPTQLTHRSPIAEWYTTDGQMFGTHLYILDDFGGPGILYAQLVDVSGYGGPWIYSQPGVITANTWQHVALTYDAASGNAYLYRNGEVVAHIVTHMQLKTSYDFYIGVRPGWDGPYYFPGRMDEVALYNRALTAEEITSIYNAGSFGKTEPNPLPVINKQPQDQAVLAGANATFSVQASGNAPLFYQWQFNAIPIAGATSSTLVLNNVQTAQAGAYSVVVSNALGSATSASAQLTVTPALQFFDASTDFSTNANPSGAWSYGWKSNFSGDFTLYGHYKRELIYLLPEGSWLDVWLKELGGSSAVAYNSSSVPVYTQDGQTEHLPGEVSFWPGANGCIDNFAGVRFTAPNTGTYLLSSAVRNPIIGWHAGDSDYHVLHNGEELFGAFLEMSTLGHTNTAEYTDAINLEAGDSLDFLCGRGENPDFNGAGLIVKISIGLLEAEPVPPRVTLQPQAQVTLAGHSVTFKVTAFGAPPLTYQWLHDGEAISGATSGTFTLNNVQTNQAGNYSVAVANAYGAVTSAVALLTVNLPSAVTLPEGMVSWWAGDGNTADSVGGNDGSPTGGLAYGPGEVGQAFVFNGANTGVRVPRNPSLDVGIGGGMTIEAWINPTQLGHRGSIAEWYTTEGQMFGTHLYILDDFGGPGILYAQLVDASGWGGPWIYSAPGVIAANTWQHVALTYDPGTGNAYLYRNGEVVAHIVTSMQLETSYDFYIGVRPGWDGPNYFEGSIDEMGLYNRALTQDEITAIYEAGSLGKTQPNPVPLITRQPQTQTVLAGNTAAFSVQASGAPPLSYQWLFNGVEISGATGKTLTLNSVQTNQAGSYAVVVANTYATVTSSVAQLTVNLPSTTTTPDGLISWWAGEGNTADSASGNNGSSIGDLLYAPGKVGQAFQLNGYDAAVMVPANPTLNVGLAPGYTIETWINPAFVAGHQPIAEWYDISRSTFGSSFYVLGDFGAGTLFADIVQRAGSSHMVYSGPGVVQPNSWQHVAVTYEKTTGFVTLYHNGVAVAQRAVGSFTPQTGYDFYIGARPGWDGPFYFQGLLDELGLYNRALTSNEVAAIYAAGSAGRSLEIPPHITYQPQRQTALVGMDVTLAVGVSGTAPLSYQWYFNDTEIPGATEATLTLTQVQLSQSGNYSVRVTNVYGAVVSDKAALLVATEILVPPSITQQPQSQLVFPGVTAMFTVEATGSAPLSYQWYFRSNIIAGATASTLVLSNVQASQGGRYWVVVSNPAGVTNSLVVGLDVITSADGGTVNFQNRSMAAGIDAPISYAGSGPAPEGRVNGTNVVSEDDFDWGGLYARAALYAGPAGSTEDQLVFLAPCVNFRTGVAAGYINSAPASSRAVPGVNPGSPAVAQVRAWDAGVPGVGTYEEALNLASTRSVYLGKSALVTVASLGGGPYVPASLTGLTGFDLVYTNLNSSVPATPMTAQQWADYSQALRRNPIQLTLRSNPDMGGAMRLQFQGVMGQNYYIQASANLSDWVTIGTATPALDGTVVFDDSNAVAGQPRFYRVVVP